MTDGSIDRRALLNALAEAYASGDAPRGDSLLTDALDAGIAWDQVTTAAAIGMARRYEERASPERVA